MALLVLACCITCCGMGWRTALADSGPFANRKIATSLTSFNVPFKINNPTGSYIEVQLYVSRDKGKSWAFYQRQDIGAGAFKFKSDGDGEYWFALKTLDRNRQLIPPGKIIQPELQIVVDTGNPVLDFRVQSDAAGRVITNWKITDENIDSESLKISHRDLSSNPGGSEWQTVDFQTTPRIVNNSWSDQVAWWPAIVTDQIEVRCEVADTAGNQVFAVRRVMLRSLSRNRSDTNSTTGQNAAGDPAAAAIAAQANTWKQLRKPSQPAMHCENGICHVPDQLAARVDSDSGWNRSTPAQGPGARRNRTLVGSPPEYVAPPPPEATTRIAANDAVPGNTRSPQQGPEPDSISWESKSTRWAQREQISNASTREHNQFPADRPDEILVDAGNLKRRFQDVPVVNQQPNRLGPTTNQSVSDAATWQQGNMTVSQSTARSRGVPQPVPATVSEPVARPRGAPVSGVADNDRDNRPFVLPDQKMPGLNPQKIPRADHLATPIGSQDIKFPPDSSTPRLNVNSQRFNLNYDVRSIDPSGVGRVILWATEDGGRSWQSWAADPDNVSPFPVEVKNEGIYGFRIVINSRDGLTGKPPASGDPPDVWVQVDTTRPDVALTSVPFGSGKDAGKLIIHWDAADPFLTLRPIRLYYSPNLDGPWTTIESGLRNSGSFAWKVPQQVPQQIFLRIEAIDMSDNIGAYQLTAPIDISGLVPRGKILGVEAIPNAGN